ncbi:MAG: 3-oxoacyl-ACP reductase FabG [Proteobacteria bacterium]|nr:3-oxoacyl-ACP reductase FabG [Pseudomonadota bacterium]
MILKDETALVTGASRGIGAAIAAQLAAAGARVIGTATSAEGAAKISAALGDRGRGAVLDVADQLSVDSLLDDIEKREGAVTVLCNNAGITRDTLLLRMKAEDWNAVLNTNLGSVFRLSKAVLRGMMKARKGRIISIASVVGSIGNPGQTNYAAAKAGIVAFSKSLAREVGSRGITVNVISPGFIDTDMTRALNEQQREALLAQIPLGRLGKPEDVAAAVLYLASAAGAYVTGETLHINGGMHMA